MREPAEHTQPVVDGDNDDALAGEPCAVIERVPARPSGQGSAIYPEEDRRVACSGGCPDIQREAVLTHRHWITRVEIGELWLGLEACWPELSCFSNASPYRHRARRCPACFSHGRQRVRDALEHLKIARRPALHRPGRSLYDRAVWRIGRSQLSWTLLSKNRRRHDKTRARHGPNQQATK